MLFHEKLLSIVSQVTGISTEDIISQSRKRDTCMAKQLYAYFLRVKFHLKLKQISAIMKNDHSSVIHCMKVIENMMWIKDDKTIGYINEINTCLVNLDGLNFVRKLKLNIPIHCDIDRLKTALIEEYGCSIEFVYE
jgi:hypothetical protein